MIPVRLIPFLLTPIVAQGYEEKPSFVDKPAAISEQQKNQGMDIDKLVDSIRSYLKLPELTLKEKKAVDEAEEFLLKYTNGKLNYGTIPRLIEGLELDPTVVSTVNKEGRRRGLISGMSLRRYPNNLFPGNKHRIQNEIRKKAVVEIEKGLEELGVDPKTISKTDNSPNHCYVTRAKLERFRDNMHIIRDIPTRLPPSKQVIFPEGFSVEDVRFIRSRTIGIPPNGVVVNGKNRPENISVTFTLPENAQDNTFLGMPVVDDLFEGIDTGASTCLRFISKVSNF